MMRSKKKPRSTKPLARLQSFGPAPLLQGEDAEAYDENLSRLRAEIKPEGLVEEILIRDIADHDWEFLRLQRVKVAYLQSLVAHKIQSALEDNFEFPDEQSTEEDNKTDGGDENLNEADLCSAQGLANGWMRCDEAAIDQIRCMLIEADIQLETLEAEALLDEVDTLDRIDRMIGMAENARDRMITKLERNRFVSAHLSSVEQQRQRQLVQLAPVDETDAAR